MRRRRVIKTHMMTKEEDGDLTRWKLEEGTFYLFCEAQAKVRVESRSNKPLFDEVLGIAYDFPDFMYGEKYGKEPRYNETSLY